MFRAPRAHHQERQIVSIQPLVTVTLCWWPCRVQVGGLLPTCTRHGHNIFYRYTGFLINTKSLRLAAKLVSAI